MIIAKENSINWFCEAETTVKYYVNGIEIPHNLNEEMLEKLLASWPEKWAAFEALGNKNTLRSLEILKKYALSQDKYEKVAAIKALSNHTLGAHTADILHENLSAPDELIITTAIEAIGKLTLKQFHDEIHCMLKSRSSEIRNSAIRSINQIWLSSDLDELSLIYQKDQLCRKEAAYVLYQHADPHNWKTIFELLAHDEQVHRHRVWACHIAGQYGGKDIIEAIKILANDKDGHVRRHAEHTLAILAKE